MKSKYGAKKCQWNGRTYDSKAEMEYHRDVLDLLVRGGELEAVECQSTVRFTPIDTYRVDFLAKPSMADPTTWYWIDVKGMQTPKFNKDVKRWKALGPGPLHIVKRKGRSRWSTEVICPCTSALTNWLWWCESTIARGTSSINGPADSESKVSRKSVRAKRSSTRATKP